MTLTPRIAVIADDLTGALDAVAPFAQAGLRCFVATGPDRMAAALLHEPQVVAVSTNSRDLASDLARIAVTAVTTALRNTPVLFKKIDSRLKGNIAAEVLAMADAAGLRQVLLCPAIPQMGRVVSGGRLQGFGVTAPMPVATVLADAARLRVHTPDAVSDADIDAILTSIAPGTLLIGARGLSAGLARQFPQRQPAPIPSVLPRPLAFVIGSRDPKTLQQVAALRQAHPVAQFIAAPNGQADPCLAGSGVIILQAVPGDSPTDPLSVTQALAASCRRLFVTPPAAMLLTGGDTSLAVLTEIGVGVLQVLGEAQPGMPLCRAPGPGAPLIVTKSGGFGLPDALSRFAAEDPS